MYLPRRILFRIIGSIAAAFMIAIGITWALHGVMAQSEARQILRRVLDDVQDQIESEVNRRCVMKAMQAREKVLTLPDTNVETLKKLAEELRVDAICIADKEGRFVASSTPVDIGRTCHEYGAQAEEFLCLLEDETEYAQALRPRGSDGILFKYVGVWRPEGGFIQIGCSVESLRRAALSSVVGISRYRHVGGSGRVVVTTDTDEIISDAVEIGLEGSILKMPDEAETFISSRDIEGFHIYAFLPKEFATIWRLTLTGVTSFLTLVVIFFSVVFVGISVAGYVREQIEKRLAGDLQLAKDIQLSALPNVFPPYPHELRMDIFARMDTAREVGGDFYDFYHVGSDRFAFLIADVSGKGVPAALFMMRAKATIKSCMTSIAQFETAIEAANSRLAEANTANVFVTCWIGVVDLRTGKLEYINCGHNPPCVRHAAGGVERLAAISGPALGIFEKIPYRKHELSLSPKDLVYLYTDGVTEAIDKEEQMFGEQRLHTILTSDETPQALCRAVKGAVDEFAGGIEQFDDITQLAFCYRGDPKRSERAFDAVETSLPVVSAFVEEELNRTDCPDDIRMRLLIAVDEIASNIVHHSHSPDMRVVVERAEQPPVVRLTFLDSGVMWNPIQHRDPDTTLGAEERAIGGLGLLMVKKLMDGVSYEWRDGHNVLSLRKNLPWNI